MTAARRAGVGALVAVAASVPFLAGSRATAAETVLPRGVLVVFVPGVSFEQLLAHPALHAVATHGGAALVPASSDPRGAIETAFPDAEVHPLPPATIDLRLLVVERGFGPSPAPLAELDEALRMTVRQLDVGELLLIVIGDEPSATMRERKDDALPIVVGRGTPGSLLTAEGRPSSLTSDATHRPGVVVADDIPTTIVRFVGHAVGGSTASTVEQGTGIRFVDEPPPFALHERYLAMRRMTVPIGTAAGVYVAIGGSFALAVILAAGRGRVGPGIGRVASGVALSVPVLAASLLAAGHLPTLAYATVVPFVVIVTVGATAVAMLVARREILRGPVLVAALVLLFLLVEAAAGWTAALTPLLGGSELDGGRFYGMPNVETGLLLGCSLWLAAVLPTSAGVALLAAAGLFAGMPFAGADIGGAVTLFAAAGMWPAVRGGRRRRADLLFGLAVVATGTVVVVLANRYLASAPTHISGVGDEGIGELWPTFVHRLGIGIDLIERNPFATLPVVGVLAMLVLVLRPPAPFAPSLERRPAWRAALLTILLGSVVAYLANDTGPAALGLGFGTAIAGLFYVSSADRTWKMEPA